MTELEQDLPASDDSPVEDEPAEAPPAPYVTVVLQPDGGYGLSISNGMNPVTLAGIGWWLQFLAEENIIQGRAMAAAQAASDPRNRIHVPGYSDNPLKRGN